MTRGHRTAPRRAAPAPPPAAGTFQRNIAALTPLLDALVTRRSVQLYSCELDEPAQAVRATWRMYGEVGLPWRPAIDLTGSTVFTYDAARSNRVVDYAESWDLPASTALGQLLRPARRSDRPGVMADDRGGAGEGGV